MSKQLIIEKKVAHHILTTLSMKFPTLTTQYFW